MYTIETEVHINASIKRVWELLLDFPSHQRWNPFIRSIDGRPVVGEVLSLFIQPPGGNGMRFRPTVLTVENNRELRWKGKLLLPGLFDGEHYFKLEPTASAGVILYQGEVFAGLLVPFFKSSLEGSTRQGFTAMNTALKQEAEAA